MIHALQKKILLLTLFSMPLTYTYADDSANMTRTTNHSWAGYHVGIDFGLQTNSANQALTVNDPQQSLSGQGANANQAVLLTGDVNTSKNLAIGGVHADYLIQHNNLVYGLAGGLIGSNCRTGSTRSASLNDPTKAPYPSYFSTINGQSCLSYLTEFTGKVGSTIGNTLFYVDGGVAAGRVRTSTNASITNSGNPPSDVWSGSNTKNLTGYVFGGGIQFAYTKNISLGITVSHYDLGKFSYATKPDAFTAGDQPGVNQSINGRARGNLAQIALDYQY